jgi:hypothetical protein
MALSKVKWRHIILDSLFLLVGLTLASYRSDTGGLDSSVLLAVCLLLFIQNIKMTIKHVD